MVVAEVPELTSAAGYFFSAKADGKRMCPAVRPDFEVGCHRRMGSVDQHLGGSNATSIALLRYQLKDLWKSPRGTVLRIEALALVAIALSFFLATFGSCRCWSNRWIIQKGFLAAQVLSLSLGTYSIGLMQSSPVKNEMYPIWAVSLFTLFGCVDPVTTYIGLDFKGPLSKVIFQLCLYCGYVVLMSSSTMSSGIGKSAIWALSAITFIRGFHRSLAFMLPRRTRRAIGSEEWIRDNDNDPAALLACDGNKGLRVHLPMYLVDIMDVSVISVADCARTDDIQRQMKGDELKLPEVAAIGLTIEQVCLGYSLSHLLQRRFLGFTTTTEMEAKRQEFHKLVGDDGGRLVTVIDYRRALKVVEVELGFLFEVYFTSNEFLHFYQAKAASLWTFASLIGICFVGALVAIVPGAMASSHHGVSATAPAGDVGTDGNSVTVVSTTAGDLIVTLVILVSLALLQLVQLMRCWTSNWARVAFACESDRLRRKEEEVRRQWMMRLKLLLVTKMNWFDRYLWQEKLGQFSVVAPRSRKERLWKRFLKNVRGNCPPTFKRLVGRFGVHLAVDVLGEVFVGDTAAGAAGGASVKLHDNVRASVAEFLGPIKSTRVRAEWSSLFVENGLADVLEHVPYNTTMAAADAAYAFTHRVMAWHIATCYCELVAEQPQEGSTRGGGTRTSRKNRRVAMDLSKYCAYLVVSAPELLPGPPAETKRAFEDAARRTDEALEAQRYVLEAAARFVSGEDGAPAGGFGSSAFEMGVRLGKRLLSKTTPTTTGSTAGAAADHWELLARLWVQTLLYAAPYGDAQSHMQHLSQGGEFITHLWALLYHLGIDNWEVAGIHELKDATLTTEVQVQEDTQSELEIEID